jgi:CPA2 family monovalent cation:H+ antiporter-2
VLSALLLELGGVLFGLALLSRLAGQLGFSPIPLYLLAGLAFGEGGLLPLSTSEEFIEVGAEVGVVLLLLLLGLEYSADELVTNLRSNAPAGLVDLGLNAAPGAVAALLLGWGLTGAVVLGGVTYISSSGVVAKLLADLGRLGNRETPIVLSVLVFEDLTMAVYLPVLTALLSGVSVVAGSLTVATALAAVTVVLYVALRHGPLLSRLVDTADEEVLLLRVLGITLLAAGLAQQAQVSSAVGAFLVGIALSGPAAEGARALLSPLRDLFAAVFFVFFGLRTDPSAIAPAAAVAATLAGAGVLTKLATGWWAAARTGVATVGRWRAGATLIARGEFSIVIAGLAVASGEVDPDLGPVATTYVLGLAVLGPLAARYAEPLARAYVRRRG